MSGVADNFLHDLVVLLIERARAAKADANCGVEFDRGRQFAYYEVLSLIEQQATAFGLDLSKLGVPCFHADRDFL